MNAIFGLKISLSISDRIMIATALGTGVHLSGLAAPTPPRLVLHRDDKEYLHRMQRRLEEKIAENMTYHGISEESRRRSMSNDDEEEYEYEGDTAMMMDNSPIFGNKEICVLEIDDTEDADILDSILDRFPPPGVQVFSTEELVGISLGHFVHCSQMFTQVWRGRIQPTTKDLTRICQRLLSSIYFKLRKLKPCLVSKLQIKADIDEDHELQLSLTGKFLQFMPYGISSMPSYTLFLGGINFANLTCHVVEIGYVRSILPNFIIWHVIFAKLKPPGSTVQSRFSDIKFSDNL